MKYAKSIKMCNCCSKFDWKWYFWIKKIGFKKSYNWFLIPILIIFVQMSTFSFIDVVVLVNLIWKWLKCIIFDILCLTESKSTSSTTWGQISSFIYLNFTQRRFCANRNNHATYQEGQKTSSKKHDKKSKSSSEAPVVATKITEVSAMLSSTSLQETETRVKIRSTPNSSVENIPKSTEQSSAASIKGEILFSSKYQIYS